MSEREEMERVLLKADDEWMKKDFDFLARNSFRDFQIDALLSAGFGKVINEPPEDLGRFVDDCFQRLSPIHLSDVAEKAQEFTRMLCKAGFGKVQNHNSIIKQKDEALESAKWAIHHAQSLTYNFTEEGVADWREQAENASNKIGQALALKPTEDK